MDNQIKFYSRLLLVFLSAMTASANAETAFVSSQHAQIFEHADFNSTKLTSFES